jgi:anaerobic magnesium-protoporphyrin IX monomethyl ester cyclase
MKIALIHHPLGHKIFSENLRVIDEEFCLAPPIVLAYVAAILEKAGHKIIIIDANALNLDKEKTLAILKAFSPDIIGFRADSYWFHRVVEWADYFKSVLNVKVLVGGLNITLYPEDSLTHPCFDYAIVGEALESLPSLINALEIKESIDNIKGIGYRKNGNIILTPQSDKLLNFDDYPFPARHLLPNSKYYSFTSQRKNFSILLTSTGCPYQCSFCAILRLPYRERSVQSVIDEIEECYRRFNIREIDFFDATFFINKKRSIAICEEILRKNIKIEWSCRSRVDVVDAQILDIASRAGCKRIYYGIESGSEEVLANINKNINKDQIYSAIKLTHKYKIDTLGFFMVGNPGDTRETILSSIHFAKKLNLDFIQVCRTIAKPNTGLNNVLIKSKGHDYWKEYILGRSEERRLPTPWLDLPDYEIQEYVRKFYTNFYFRPAYIIKRVSKVKSMAELIRYIRVALRWFFPNCFRNI